MVRSPSSRVVVVVVDVDDPDAVRLLEEYFAELRERFGSFDPPTREELRADARRGLVLIAYDGGNALACGSLRLLEQGTAEVKRMYVAPEARGKGHGRVLLAALEEAARGQLGCHTIVLDTAAVLEEAARMYLRAGYTEIPRYNDNPYAARWFRKDLDAA